MTDSIIDPVVIVGMGVRLPGAEDGVEQFDEMLFSGQSAVAPLEQRRWDGDLYFDKKRGVVGKTYTTLGSCVRADSFGKLQREIDALGDFDLAHKHFAEVASNCWESSGASLHDSLAERCGIFVGHSGGTERGGALALATLAEIVADQLRSVDAFVELPHRQQQQIVAGLIESIRRDRPRRDSDTVHFNAYSAASLVSRLLNLGGPREVIDAACASSLLALQHALLCIEHGRIDAAIVGGATFNNVDNLILFSQSQACSEEGSCPFDDSASGLVSSEGYVAIAIMRRSLAIQHDLKIHGIVRAVGVASDGRGKSLWAPRTEGQQLALRRAYPNGKPLTIDYQEAHATSTQVGDATELTSLSVLLAESMPATPLLVGSVKSNFGHTLEAAGLVGLVKVLLAMRREVIPPSINVTKPTSLFDWSSGSLRVVDRPMAWCKTAGVRRAAVNAFGIGGLNAHAVIEEASQGSSHNRGQHSVSRSASEKPEPIAIVGRGLVLAGAANVAEFRELMHGECTAVGAPPGDRWRDNVGIRNNPRPASFSSPTNMGGYIHDYRFDGQKYRIPPKQVRLANPAQMMLIDAVAQACGEFDGGNWTLDRAKTGIIVGTIFGGEFSNELQVGLRLPEIAQRLQEVLGQVAIGKGLLDRIVNDYQQRLLDQYTAILDETGSFTASTLASRIAKTFDLMGGACAVDADEASDGLALMLAADQLQSGTLDTVICGVAQRSLDLVAFEQMDLKGRLLRSGRVDDIPSDCSQLLPGEGVAVVMLQRLSDAKRDGRTILGVIDQVACGTAVDARSLRNQSLVQSPINRQIVSRVGYLAGAHSMIRLISETLQKTGQAPTRPITSVAEDGFYVNFSMSDLDNRPTATSGNTSTGQVAPTIQPAKRSSVRPVLMNSLASKLDSMLTLRLEADSEHEFDAALKSANRSLDESLSREAFCGGSVYRAVAFGENREELAAGVAAIQKAWNSGVRIQALPRENALLWNASCGRDRIGWVFPGQGSQYPAVPQVISQDPGAAEYLRKFDDVLTQLGHSPVTANLSDPRKQLGRDVWWTQQWVLAVSSVFADALVRHGHAPDVVLGHSFGECGAALHCGVMTVAQAIRFAKLRSDAVVMTVRQAGQLLSVRAEASQVRSVLTQHKLDCYITHQNAPNQTVIAGDVQQIETAKRLLSSSGFASVVIPVPAAFHTPLMADAQRVLASAFGHETLRPPKHAFLSATSTNYLSEPNLIRSALIEQLTHPVLYATSVRRMVDDGCGLIIEVGPSDVLTRLNQATVAGDALCLALDSNLGTHAKRLHWIDVAVECVKGQRVGETSTASPIRRSSQTHSIIAGSPASEPRESEIEIIDVTSRARRLAKSSAEKQVSNKGNDNGATKTGQATGLKPTDQQTNRPETSGYGSQQSKPILPSVPVPSSARTAGAAASHSAAQQFLIDVVVELTGYQPEVIDFEADLEAELGVDSIKKAQVIGELAEWASLELNLREIKLADFNSLGDILSLVGMSSGASDLTLRREPSGMVPPRSLRRDAAPESGHEIDLGNAGTHKAPVRPTVQSVPASGLAESIESLMIDFVVDQTGYDPDVIDLDADLESELGIDSIKKAQLLGELAEQYDLRDVELGRLSLADFLNLRSILEFVIEHCDDSSLIVDEQIEYARSTSNHADVDDDRDDEFERGQRIGSLKKNDIRDRLRARVDGVAQVDTEWLTRLLVHADKRASNGHSVTATKISSRLIEGLAHGAGVHPASLQPARHSGASLNNGASLNSGASQSQSAKELEVPSQGTCRFVLDVVRRDRRAGTPQVPTFFGDAIVIGRNAIATAMVRRLNLLGVNTHQLSAVHDAAEADGKLESIWSCTQTPHLFLTTPHDKESLGSLDAARWADRRGPAISGVFRVCQLWMQRMIDQGLMNRASLVTVTNGGGSFGLCGSSINSPESGGLAGLTKAMLIESWMRGFRETPMKVIEPGVDTTPDRFVDGVMRELAVPSYDEEAIVDGDRRWTVRARYAPLEMDAASAPRITSGGTWIVTGGGRGITALTAMALADRHNLKLVLLGTAPNPQLKPGMRERGRENRSQLRRDVMQAAQGSGQNPIEAWRDTEKALEIDITLAECAARGITATYHSVDVSDAAAVSRLLATIRHDRGPIRGVIHGAGAGQDARFDRKRADKVEKCIRAKVDGCIALANATADDPLEWFVGFGSISGRFGANGHTDYSLANDMLAKCINRLSSDRPDVRCVAFHWHAWGDIGMAAKPEAKLALEMIGMQFMPAEEGLQHFLNELEHGGDTPEVLITDRNYVRKFFPDVEATASDTVVAPMLDPSGRTSLSNRASYLVTLDPVTDRFLAEHRISDRPTLPFVIAIEMMAEAARIASGNHNVTKCTNAKALQAIKFASDDAMAVEVSADGPVSHAKHWTIKADLRRKDGRLVEEGRKFFEASFETSPTIVATKLSLPLDRSWQFKPIDYLPLGALVYHGEPLQTLREIAVVDGEAMGRIAAASPAHLGGENRPLSGWVLPCAAMDAVLYAAAMLAYHESGKPSLPVSFDEIRIGRQPDPGEPLWVHIRATRSDAQSMILTADLAGQNGDLVLSLHGYRVNWIR